MIQSINNNTDKANHYIHFDFKILFEHLMQGFDVYPLVRHLTANRFKYTLEDIDDFMENQNLCSILIDLDKNYFPHRDFIEGAKNLPYNQQISENYVLNYLYKKQISVADLYSVVVQRLGYLEDGLESYIDDKQQIVHKSKSASIQENKSSYIGLSIVKDILQLLLIKNIGIEYKKHEEQLYISNVMKTPLVKKFPDECNCVITSSPVPNEELLVYREA